MFSYSSSKSWLTSVSSIGLLALLVIGCENQKYSNCRELITSVNQASQAAQKILNVATESPSEQTTWLKAADQMKLAAQEIAALSLSDAQLGDYQASLANIFSGYHEATYQAIKARNLKDKSKLKLARDKAQQLGKFNQDLANNINRYCGE